MKIQRVTNPDISIYLLPMYVEGDKDRVGIGLELYERMTQSPDETGVFVSIEKDTINGILIGYKSEDVLFTWQANKAKDMHNPRLIFHRFCQWGKSLGCRRVMLGSEDKRARRMYKRKYGFVPITDKLMEKPL